MSSDVIVNSPAHRPRSRSGHRARALSAVLVIAGLVGLLIDRTGPAQARGLPDPSWDRTTSHGQCEYHLRLSKPLAGSYERAAIEAAGKEGLTVSDGPDVLDVASPRMDCPSATDAVSTSEPLAWKMPPGRWIAGAFVGVFVAGALAILLPQAIIAAGAAVGIAVSDLTAAVAAGCLAGATAAALSEYLKGNGAGKITDQAITACIGGAAGALARSWLTGQRALQDAAVTVADSAESMAPNAIADSAESMSSVLTELAPATRAIEDNSVQAAAELGGTLRRAHSWSPS